MLNLFVQCFSSENLSQCLSVQHSLRCLLCKQQPVSGVNLSALYGLHVCAFVLVAMGHRLGFHMTFMRLTNYRDVQVVSTQRLQVFLGIFTVVSSTECILQVPVVSALQPPLPLCQFFILLVRHRRTQGAYFKGEYEGER